MAQGGQSSSEKRISPEPLKKAFVRSFLVYCTVPFILCPAKAVQRSRAGTPLAGYAVAQVIGK